MKLVLIVTFVLAGLAIGLFGINNAFVQGDGMMRGNDNGDRMTMNATLAYAAQHWSDIGKEYKKTGESIGKDFKKMEEGKGKENRKMGEDIGKEFRNIKKGTTTIMNDTSTSTVMINETKLAPTTSNITLANTQIQKSTIH